MTRARAAAALLALAAPCACGAAERAPARPPDASGFPAAARPVAPVVSNGWSTESARDARGEATTMIDLAGVRAGMRVADVGAGEGYYAVRLARRVGARGRVTAEDIDAGAVRRLAARARGEGLGNVDAVLGDAGDPRLPAGVFDRVFLVHMYHEIAEPYALLWRLRAALRPGGQVVVIDADRPTGAHGTPPGQLRCEFAALGFRLARFVRKPDLDGYYAQFEAAGARPPPGAIAPCRPRAAANAG